MRILADEQFNELTEYIKQLEAENKYLKKLLDDAGIPYDKANKALASRVQLYRKPRKKPPFRYTVELWCIENREEYPVFDTNSLFCIENLIKVPLVDTALKSVVSKTHTNQAFSIQDHTLCI